MQAAQSPQTMIDDNAIANLQSGLEVILDEAARIEKLRPVLKNMNKEKIYQALYQLESALYRQKTDFALEPCPYDEFPWIDAKDISIGTTLANQVIEEYDATNQRLTCVRSVSKARWKDQEVAFIQYLGTNSHKKKREVLMQDIRMCAMGKHENVIELIGGATPTTNSPYPYLVFRTGSELNHVDFLRKATSLRDLMTFVGGAERGSDFMFVQGITYRDGISVSCTGVATIHPPGITLSKLTGKQSTKKHNGKRWAGHVLGDIALEFKDTALPLQEIHQILDACHTPKLEDEVSNALIAHTGPAKKKHIFQIAEDFKVPLNLTWQCVTTPNPPDYIVRPAGFGMIEGASDGQSEAPFTRWIPLAGLSSTTANPVDYASEWIDKITTRVTFKDDSRPTFKDADIPVMKGSDHPGWLRRVVLSFEDVMRNARGLNSKCRVVLNYWNQPSEKFNNYQVVFDEFLKENSYPPRVVHYARRVNLRHIFNVEPGQITVPVYLHRQPGSKSPRHYWGFLSQFADPTIPPESPITELNINYQLDLLTALEGDSWGYRADQEYEEEYVRLPGAWIA
ncbi:hypothetical protein FRC07_011567 [Ceratobasidium sp. 392]|nr:hypothetical protein FRC07_011567 [Ceratobasidium sp. 392]